jgi:hypothetical protein
MIWNDVFCNTFRALREKIEPEVKKKIDFTLPSMPMVNVCRADDFDFFQPLIDSGDLTIDQMHHAAQRYHLGKSKSGHPIFWMIDDLGIVHDGHIGNSWVSQMLKSRYPDLAQYIRPQHCLFGLHLLCHTDYTDMKSPISAVYARTKKSVKSVESVCDLKTICVVESERSAVVLSEIFPESIWMAYSYTANLTVDLLEPLQGRTVTIYPRTDPFMNTYLFFLEYVNTVHQTYPCIHLTIDDTLEENTSSDQKSRCIDLLDFILDDPQNF